MSRLIATVGAVALAGMVSGCGGKECGPGTQDVGGVCTVKGTDTAGTYEALCQNFCTDRESPSKCQASDATGCLQGCRAKTNNLTAPCAQCLIDNSDALSTLGSSSPGDGGYVVTQWCSGGELVAISSDKCLSFCKNG